MVLEVTALSLLEICDFLSAAGASSKGEGLFCGDRGEYCPLSCTIDFCKGLL